jgi:hypothetical protein
VLVLQTCLCNNCIISWNEVSRLNNPFLKSRHSSLWQHKQRSSVKPHPWKPAHIRCDDVEFFLMYSEKSLKDQFETPYGHIVSSERNERRPTVVAQRSIISFQVEKIPSNDCLPQLVGKCFTCMGWKNTCASYSMRGARSDVEVERCHVDVQTSSSEAVPISPHSFRIWLVRRREAAAEPTL